MTRLSAEELAAIRERNSAYARMGYDLSSADLLVPDGGRMTMAADRFALLAHLDAITDAIEEEHAAVQVALQPNVFGTFGEEYIRELQGRKAALDAVLALLRDHP